MERENFYILLDLSINPPETDAAVIKQTIKKKQAEWSKLRNHPTKGLQAQKNISLIPEIEKVMLDPQLRAEELEAAKNIIKQGKESKYPEIDRHIDILMGKGFISQEEVFKLANVHGLSQNEIQDRINAKKQEKFGHIDRAISLRMDKGYITEAEIAKIAKRHSLTEDEVRRRVRCPIKKDDKGKNEVKPRHIDKSLEKTINDNLRILGKSSLYDFLGLPESADLESLQTQAGRKKKELSNISRRDATATASNTLAGHCMTIFKSDETRNSYDISLARCRLAALDSDIDIAAINGKIRPEYYDVLVQKAMEFGMDQEEANAYIQGYCRRKGYKVDKAPDKRKKQIIIGGALAAAVIVAVAAGFIFSAIHQNQIQEAKFQSMMANVSQQQTPEKKLKLLGEYLNANPPEEYLEPVQKKIQKVQEQIKKHKYAAAMEKADQFEAAGDYEKAAAAYQQFIERNPGNPYISQAKKQIDKMASLVEGHAYEELKTVMVNGTAGEKIAAAQAYISNHPNGAHREQIDELIDDMSSEYFIFVKNRLNKCENQENWGKCIELCENYIELYDNSHTDQLKQLLPKYQKRQRDEQVFATLKDKAAQKGSDYRAARQVFQDYLEAYPDTTVKEDIRSELARLDERLRQKRIDSAKEQIRAELSRAGDRFIEKSDGVVVLDKKTGLMWTLVDSSIMRPNECLTYDMAREYAKNLRIGGYSDWELPTPAQLAGIYKEKPFFPASDTKWYWSSENYSSYSDGWHKIVDTVTGQNKTDWEVIRRHATECGTVRAVRQTD